MAPSGGYPSRCGHALAALLCLVVVCTRCASEGVRYDTAELSAVLDRALARHRVPAAAVALLSSGQDPVIVVRGEGVDEQTLWQVGAVSMPVSAWGAMRLVQEDIVSLDAPVSKHINRWTLPRHALNRYAKRISLRTLLSHSAGLKPLDYPGFPPNATLPSLEESLSGMTNGAGRVELKRKPGIQFQYSSGGYTLMQLLMEQASGMPFAEYMRENILLPLGMTSSTFDPSPEHLARVARAHTRWLGFVVRPVPNYRFTAMAATGLYSTVGDLAKFLSVNMLAHEEAGVSSRASSVYADDSSGITRVHHGNPESCAQISSAKLSRDANGNPDDRKAIDEERTGADSGPSVHMDDRREVEAVKFAEGHVYRFENEKMCSGTESMTGKPSNCDRLVKEVGEAAGVAAGATTSKSSEEDAPEKPENGAVVNDSDGEKQRWQVLRPGLTRLMHKAVHFQFGNEEYGLGFELPRFGRQRLVGHSGQNRGWTSQIHFSTKYGEGIVILANSDGGPGLVSDIRCYWGRASSLQGVLRHCEELHAARVFQLQIGVALCLFFVAFAVMVARSNPRLEPPRKHEKRD